MIIEMEKFQKGSQGGLWWGLHLLPSRYLMLGDHRLEDMSHYDNQVKFLWEARDAMAWYFVNRVVVAQPEFTPCRYFKYVPFDCFDDEDQGLWPDWERRYPPEKIDPAPGRLCVFRDDVLNFKKEMLMKRYYELLTEPVDRDYTEDQRIIQNRGNLKEQLRSFLYKQSGIEKLGVISPINLMSSGFDSLRHDIDHISEINLIVELKKGTIRSIGGWESSLGDITGKKITITEPVDFYELEISPDRYLDNYFTLKKTKFIPRT